MISTGSPLYDENADDTAFRVMMVTIEIGATRREGFEHLTGVRPGDQLDLFVRVDAEILAGRAHGALAYADALAYGEALATQSLRSVDHAGPTCDSFDTLSLDVKIPELYVGDVVYVKNIGAYSSASAVANFNGFAPAKIVMV